MIQELDEYQGRNPFLNHLKVKATTKQLTAFEKEYVARNLNYCGYDLDMKLEVGRRNEEYLNKQFQIEKNITEIKVDYLWGETDQAFHFSYKNKSFFVYKNDCEDPFKKITESIDVDFFKYEKVFGHSFFTHQKSGIKFMLSSNLVFNWDDMGLGKTLMSIVTALESDYKRVLVITLASLKLNWRREISAFKQDSKIISGSTWDNTPSKFTIINYEILKNFVEVKKSKAKGSNQMLLENFDCIILDEVHKAKNPTSILSQCIKGICTQKSVKKIIGLSGTPFEKNIDFYNICRTLGQNVSDVVMTNGWYGQVVENYRFYAFRYCNAYEQVLDSPKTKAEKAEIMELFPIEVKRQPYVRGLLNIIQQNGRRITKLKDWEIAAKGETKMVSNLTVEDAKYIRSQPFEDRRKKVLVLGQKIGGEKIENTNTIELQQRIKHVQIRRTKKDVLDCFPDKFVLPIYLSLSSKQKLLYNEMWEEYALEKNLKNFTPDQLEKITESIKIRQFLASIKVEHTCNFVENKIEDGLKVIVFTHFKEEYEHFVNHFKKEGVGIDASMTAEKKQKVIDLFQNDEKVKVIIGNIKTLGTGHNLTKGDIVVINSPDWNSGEHEQAEDRAYRIGRNEDVNVYYCLFEETHEEEVYERSKQKAFNKQILLKST